jgi:hypothetical protein
MTAAVAPLFAKGFVVSLTFGAGPAVDVACHVRDAQIVPTPGKIVEYVPLCTDASYVETADDTFVLSLTGVQDWSATGLARLLWDHAGEEVPFVVNAYGDAAPSATHPSMTGTARAVRPAYGGERDAWAEIDVDLPVIGTPALDATP